MARQVQWASEVVAVSSERKQDPVGEGYKAIQALGEPEKVPSLSLSPCAWSPAKMSQRADEWIHLGFASPQQVKQLFIVENAGAGAITQVFLYDTEGQEHLIYEDWANYPPEASGRILPVVLPEKTSYAVASAKIVMSTLDIKGWNQIDAVGLSSEVTTVDQSIETATPDLGGKPELLPSYINSPYEEILPITMPDGSGLFFVRKSHPYNTDNHIKPNDDIWYVELAEDGSWGDAYRMPSPLNNGNHNFVSSITPDANTLILGNSYMENKPNIAYQHGLSFSERTKTGWSFPQELPIINHYNWSTTEEFYMGSSEKTLIFAVQRKDSKGAKDLYVSFYSEADQIWSEPKHMGNAINSPADEAAPFLAADERTLYFASKGFRGYGDFDLYVSKRLDDTWENWSEPKNLGKPFNSPAPDVSFSIDAFGEYAYFASAKYDQNGRNDLLRIPLPKSLQPNPIVIIEGTVYNQSDSLPVGATIRYSQLLTGHALGKANSDPNTGQYRIALPLRNAYSFFAEAPNFISIEDNIDLKEINIKETYKVQRDLYLVPLKVGQVIRLNNVFFKQSLDELLPSSFPELKRLANTLAANPQLKIVLEGHTDIEGKPGENMQLSEDRVKKVQEFLMSKGIDKKRLKIKAYGANRPLSRLRTPEAKKANRRVEVRILEID